MSGIVQQKSLQNQLEEILRNVQGAPNEEKLVEAARKIKDLVENELNNVSPNLPRQFGTTSSHQNLAHSIHPAFQT